MIATNINHLGYFFDATTPGNIKPEYQSKDAVGADQNRKILCRLCRHIITENRQKIRRQGQFIHRHTNPAGLTFEFGCYAEAPGCSTLGPATGEHTWFQGYYWKLALCKHCSEHLGWLFQANDSFYGLIQARLV